jgi:hypothetical protein
MRALEVPRKHVCPVPPWIRKRGLPEMTEIGLFSVLLEKDLVPVS